MKLDRHDFAMTNCCSKEGSNPALKAVCFRNGKLIAANGFILIAREADITSEEKTEEEFLMPTSVLKIAKPKNNKAEVSFAKGIIKFTYKEGELNKPIQYEPEIYAKTEIGKFPNYLSIINESSTKKKAQILLSIRELKKVLSTMPDDGHIALGIESTTAPIEFECTSMKRPVRGLLMPIFTDWDDFKWHREQEKTK